MTKRSARQRFFKEPMPTTCLPISSRLDRVHPDVQPFGKGIACTWMLLLELPHLWEASTDDEGRKLLVAMLDAVHVDTKLARGSGSAPCVSPPSAKRRENPLRSD